MNVLRDGLRGRHGTKGGDHIIDGRTGHPATGLLSLTIVARP